MEKAFQPLARMMNLILGDDPSGKGAPLDRFLDNIDEKSKEFDNWVKSGFEPTWKGLEKVFQDDWNAIKGLFEARTMPTWMAEFSALSAAAKDAWAFLSGYLDAAVKAIEGVAGYTKDHFPWLNIDPNLVNIWHSIVEDWKLIGDILKPLEPVMKAIGEHMGTIAGVGFGALEAAIWALQAPFIALNDVLRLTNSLIQTIMGHPDTSPGMVDQAKRVQAADYLNLKSRLTPDQLDKLKQSYTKRGINIEENPYVKSPSSLNTPFVEPAKHAEGGIVTSPHVGMVGEAGPEAIIPLSGPTGPNKVLNQILGLFGMVPNVMLQSEAYGLAHMQDTPAQRLAAEKESSKGIRDFWGKVFGQAFGGLESPVPRFAEGGIVTKPTTAMIGEAGPEAIIPLESAGSELENVLVPLKSTGESMEKHAIDTNKKLKESEASTVKMGEIFAALPTVSQQFVTQINSAVQAMSIAGGGMLGSEMLGGAGPGAVGGGGPPGFTGTSGGILYTEYGPSIDPPGSADYDSNSYNRVGAWPGITGKLQPGDVALGYGAQAFYHVRPGQTFTDTRGNVVRFADRSGSKNPMNEDVFRLAEGGIVHEKMLSWLGERGSEAVIPLTRTPRAMALLEHAATALGAGGIGSVHFAPVINLSGASAEAGEAVQMALRQAHEQLERMLEDILRRHRREQFA
jgi:hypothetical protein